MRLSAHIRWIIATALGLATFGSVTHFPGDFFHQNLGAATGWDFSAAAVGMVFGAVAGAIVGFLQWLLLMLHAGREVLGVDLGGVAVGGLAIGLVWGGLTAAAGFPSRSTTRI